VIVAVLDEDGGGIMDQIGSRAWEVVRVDERAGPAVAEGSEPQKNRASGRAVRDTRRALRTAGAPDRDREPVEQRADLGWALPSATSGVSTSPGDRASGDVGADPVGLHRARTQRASAVLVLGRRASSRTSSRTGRATFRRPQARLDQLDGTPGWHVTEFELMATAAADRRRQQRPETLEQVTTPK
jgi:hypothetical protein